MREWLQTKVHISWHLACAALGIVMGAAARLYPDILADDFWLVVITILAGLVILSRRRYLLVAALVVGLLAGGTRGSYELLALRAYTPYYDQVVTARGTLGEDSATDDHGGQQLLLKHVHVDGHGLPGHLWASTASKVSVKRGDTITLTGKLDQGFGNIPSSMYRADITAVQRPYPGDVARRVRDWFAEGIRRLVPEPEASLGIGYLTGQRSTLPQELDEQLRTVGLTHAIVASGYNLTILVSFARQWLQRISKYFATLTAATMIGFFVLITGLSPSMSRAGLVTSLSLAAWYYGRTMHPLVLLPIAAAITVLIDPAYVWGDIGWCLSFAAFTGVIILGPLIRSYLWPPDHSPNMLISILIDTTAAQVMTLPIILHVFGQYATYALLANMLVLPLIPLAMLSTFIAGIVGIVVPTLELFGLPALLVLQYMTRVIATIAHLPGAQEDIAVDRWVLIGSYLFLLLLCFYLWRTTRHDFRSDSSQKYI